MNASQVPPLPLPEYRPKSFHSLWKLLGESDAGLEWLEVAVRELLRRHRDNGAADTQALAHFHAVRVNDLNAEAVRDHWSRLQVITVAQYVELFLDRFHAEIIRDTRVRQSKEDLVTYTLDIYKVKKATVGELQCNILDYYRKIRNHFVHDPSAEDPKMLVRQAEALRSLIAKGGTSYGSLSAPNAPASVSFDDFILFSRALKDFSKGLCSAVSPTQEELRLKITADARAMMTMRRPNTPERRTKFLANYIRQHFGFHSTAESIAEKLLLEGLLAQR